MAVCKVTRLRAQRRKLEDLSNRSMFIAILGCNLAWAVVDGVMYVLVAVFEQGRRYRIARRIQGGGSDEQAIGLIHQELGDQLERLCSPEVPPEPDSPPSGRGPVKPSLLPSGSASSSKASTTRSSSRSIREREPRRRDWGCAPRSDL